MKMTDLSQFEPEPEPTPPIKKQPLKLAGFVALIVVSAPLWIPIGILFFCVALPLAHIAEGLRWIWRKFTGYQEPERSLTFSSHSRLADGSICHFQLSKPITLKTITVGEDDDD